MLPDRVSNPGPLTYKSGALPIALRDLAVFKVNEFLQGKQLHFFYFCNPSQLDFLFTHHISSVIRQNFYLPKQNPKDLDPSCKMDLDLWDCLGRVKLVL